MPWMKLLSSPEIQNHSCEDVCHFHGSNRLADEYTWIIEDAQEGKIIRTRPTLCHVNFQVHLLVMDYSLQGRS